MVEGEAYNYRRGFDPRCGQLLRHVAELGVDGLMVLPAARSVATRQEVVTHRPQWIETADILGSVLKALRNIGR